MKGRFIYLAHPRTASMATEKALSMVCPGGITTKAHHAQLHEIPHDDESIFTTIRDPLDVLVSWWEVNIQWHKPQSDGGPTGSDGSFLDFINQYEHTYLTIDGELFFHLQAAKYNYLRYEYLQEGFDIAMEALRLPTITIPKLNITKNKDKDYMSMYGDKELEAMWNRFPSAMELYYNGDKHA